MSIYDGELTQGELEDAASSLADGNQIESLSLKALEAVLTIGQYLTDRCLVEIEERGELVVSDGQPVLPYVSDHSIESILARSH